MFARNMSRKELLRFVSAKTANELMSSAPEGGDHALYLGDQGSVWGGCSSCRGDSIAKWLRMVADDTLNIEAFVNHLLLEVEQQPSLEGIARALGFDQVSIMAKQLNTLHSIFFLPIALRSATAVPHDCRVYEPLMTVYQGKQIGTVDYILYSEDALKVSPHTPVLNRHCFIRSGEF